MAYCEGCERTEMEQTDGHGIVVLFRLFEIVIPERHIPTEKCENVFFHIVFALLSGKNSKKR
jgi:hypothetical protein